MEGTARASAESSETSEKIWKDLGGEECKKEETEVQTENRASREICSVHGTRSAWRIWKEACGRGTVPEDEVEPFLGCLWDKVVPTGADNDPSVLVTATAQVLTVNKTFMSIPKQLNWLQFRGSCDGVSFSWNCIYNTGSDHLAFCASYSGKFYYPQLTVLPKMQRSQYHNEKG